MSSDHKALATAIASVLESAQNAGMSLSITVSPPSTQTPRTTNGPVDPRPVVAMQPEGSILQHRQRLNDMDSALLVALHKAPNETITMEEFGKHLGYSIEEIRRKMRGAGRRADSVKDVYYDRFDTPRPEGGQIRTYRLTDRGREVARTLA